MNLAILKQKEGYKKMSRTKFNEYPIYVQHTLFYTGKDFQKVREFECCSRFMAYE